MFAALHVALQLALGLLMPAWIIRRDEAALSPERLARAWNEASLWSAVATFGPLALIVHFTRTRRSFGGFARGLLYALVVFGASWLLGLGFP